MIGIQVGSHSIFDEGPEHVLDTVQETFGGNALLLYSHDYTHFVGRRTQAQVADHGQGVKDTPGRELTKVWVRRSDERFYRDTCLRHETRPGQEFIDRDVFDEVLEVAHRRGVEIHARILERAAPHLLSNWSRVAETGLGAGHSIQGCWRKPDYVHFWLGTAEDLFAHYDLDGFHFGAERSGPLSRILFYGQVNPGCFCQHCLRAGRDRGIDPDRARAGLARLVELMRAPRKNESVLMQVLRVLLEYPDALAWDRLQHAGREDLFRRIYSAVKGVKPEAKVGWHLYHWNLTFDIFGRANYDPATLAQFSDYIKPCTYQDASAQRLPRAIQLYGKALLQDMPPAAGMEMLLRIMGIDPQSEPSLEELPQRGMSDRSVGRLTASLVEGADGAMDVIPGIGTDVLQTLEPDKAAASSATATRAAIQAGAAGVILCREYDEMRMETLRAVGEVLAEQGLARPSR
jgi:hypothetical protein